MPRMIKDYFLPGRVEAALQQAGLFQVVNAEPGEIGDVSIEHLQVTPQVLSLISQELRRRRQELLAGARLPNPETALARMAGLRQLASSLARPDYPFRQEALDLLPRISGFSPQMVRLLLDSFAQFISNEHFDLSRFTPPPNAAALGFAPTSYGYARYYPGKLGVSLPMLLAKAGQAQAPYSPLPVMGIPHLVASIAAGNVPGVSILQAFFPLLIGAACLGKNPSEEPYFGPHFLAALAEMERAGGLFPLSDLAALVTFSGAEKTLVKELIHQSDHLIVTGGHEAKRQILSMANGLRLHGLRDLKRRVSGHWHKVSFDIVAHEYLDDAWIDLVAQNVAFDNSMFNTQGCLSCQQVFVEGDETQVLAFARRYIEQMKILLQRLPKGGEAQAGLRQMYTTYEKIPGVKILTSLRDMETAPFFVAYEDQSRDFVLYNALNRSILIRCVDRLETDLPRLLGRGQLSSLLQSCAAAIPQARLLNLADHLGRAAVNRIVAAGNIWDMLPGIESWDGYLPPYDLLAPQSGYWTTICFHDSDQALRQAFARNQALLESE